MTATRKPSLDPDGYDPLSSPQFVHPSLVVWRWRRNLYDDIRSAVRDFVFWSVIMSARHGKTCFASAAGIAARLGARDGDGGRELSPKEVWEALHGWPAIVRLGTRGQRRRPWGIRGLVEPVMDDDAHPPASKAGIPNRLEPDSQSAKPRFTIGQEPIPNRLEPDSHNSEVCRVQERNECIGVEGNHTPDNHPPFAHGTRHTDGTPVSPPSLVFAPELIDAIKQAVKRRWSYADVYTPTKLDYTVADETIEEFHLDSSNLPAAIDDFLDSVGTPSQRNLTVKAFKAWLLATVKGVGTRGADADDGEERVPRGCLPRRDRRGMRPEPPPDSVVPPPRVITAGEVLRIGRIAYGPDWQAPPGCTLDGTAAAATEAGGAP